MQGLFLLEKNQHGFTRLLGNFRQVFVIEARLLVGVAIPAIPSHRD